MSVGVCGGRYQIQTLLGLSWAVANLKDLGLSDNVEGPQSLC